MTTPMIQLENISYSYRNENTCKKIFTNFSETVFKTEHLAVMAPSGRGKTTLLFLIAGLIVPQCGSIVYGVSKPKFSIVFQENRLLEQETVRTNLFFINPSLTEETILDMLQKIDLAKSFGEAKLFSFKKVCQLSGGEKRRVALIRALLANYDILLLDEPFTGLDEQTKVRALHLVKNMSEKKTIILSTHELADAELLNCRILKL